MVGSNVELTTDVKQVCWQATGQVSLMLKQMFGSFYLCASVRPYSFQQNDTVNWQIFSVCTQKLKILSNRISLWTQATLLPLCQFRN